MYEKVYMHAINSKDYDYFYSRAEILTLAKILRDGAILSLREQGNTKTRNYGFNGLDYISLCDYEKRNLVTNGIPNYNSYHSYVKYGISLAFDKQDLEVIEPKKIDAIHDAVRSKKRIRKLGLLEERYSDFLDEVQVKDRISLDKLLYLTYPVRQLYNNYYIYEDEKINKLLMHEISEIRSLLDYYHHNVPIYDIESQILLDEKGIKKLTRKK